MIDYYEVCKHINIVHGTMTDSMSQNEIKSYLESVEKLENVNDIRVCFDDFQGIWRFNCKIGATK